MASWRTFVAPRGARGGEGRRVVDWGRTAIHIIYEPRTVLDCEFLPVGVSYAASRRCHSDRARRRRGGILII